MEKLYRKAIGFGRCRLPSEQDAEDFAGWVIERRLRGVGLKQPLYYALVDFIRETYSKVQQHSVRLPTIEQGAECPEHARMVVRDELRAMKAIPERDRHILKRLFVDDWTYQEIGDELGVGQTGISHHLARILPKRERKNGNGRTKKK